MARTPHPGDEQLLQALAHGQSVEQAAQTAGVSERTVYRRLATPSFQKRLQAIRDELVTAALGELAGSASGAVAALKHLLHSNDERVRLAAAKALLDQLLKLRDTVTLEQRLTALERNVAHAKRKGRW